MDEMSLCTAVLGLFLSAAGLWAADRPPRGVEQILPRGRLAAIDQPTYVGAAAAKIPDDAWVLGVFLDGEARAFDLNLLNRHEVVNDRIGETAYAAVW